MSCNLVLCGTSSSPKRMLDKGQNHKMETSLLLTQPPNSDRSKSPEHTKNLQEFLHYAKNVLPSIASTKKNTWPIRHDHCFIRVILDNICNCAWYDSIPSPAYKNLTDEQACAALNLAKQIANESVSLYALNQRSKQWRKKQLKLKF